MMKPAAFRIFAAVILLACLLAQPAPARANEPEPEPETLPVPLFLPLLTFGSACETKLAYQPPSDETVEIATMQRINAERAVLNLPALAHSPAITQIARFHSRDMSYQGDEPKHTGTAGETYTTRFSWLCEGYSYRNEIIGWGFNGDMNRMMEWWLASEVHHNIILDGAENTPSRGYTHFGAGYFFDPNTRWRSYWTVNFGKTTALSSPAASPQQMTCTITTAVSPEGGASAIICE